MCCHEFTANLSSYNWWLIFEKKNSSGKLNSGLNNLITTVRFHKVIYFFLRSNLISKTNVTSLWNSGFITTYSLLISDFPGEIWFIWFFFFYYYSSQYCQGFMNLAGRPVAAFDPEGLIFAVGINSESVKLYDLRSFDKGPFSSFKFPSGKKMTKDSLNGPNFVVLCTYDFTRCNYNPSYFDLSKHTMWTVNDVPGKEPSGSFLDYLSNSVTQGHYWRSTVYLKFIYSKIFWEGHIILGNFHLT